MAKSWLNDLPKVDHKLIGVEHSTIPEIVTDRLMNVSSAYLLVLGRDVFTSENDSIPLWGFRHNDNVQNDNCSMTISFTFEKSRAGLAVLWQSVSQQWLRSWGNMRRFMKTVSNLLEHFSFKMQTEREETNEESVATGEAHSSRRPALVLMPARNVTNTKDIFAVE